jgi:hypothetical protein
MSHFYGRVKGGRGEATRCGHKTTGMRTSNASWEIEVVTQFSHANGEDWVNVVAYDKSGVAPPKVLYAGAAAHIFAPPPPVMAVPAFTLKEINDAQDELRNVKYERDVAIELLSKAK